MDNINKTVQLPAEVVLDGLDKGLADIGSDAVGDSDVADGSEMASETPSDEPLSDIEAIDPLQASALVSGPPQVARTATLRTSNPGKVGYPAYSTILTVPKAILEVVGLQAGDVVLMEAWAAEGAIRMRLVSTL